MVRVEILKKMDRIQGGTVVRYIISLVSCVVFIMVLPLSGYAAADDELAFEAEDFDAILPPMQVGEDEDASGGKYIKSPNGRAGWAEYDIEIPEDADYYMWGTGQIKDGVTDSFFVTFDLDDRGEDDADNENTWDMDGAPVGAWGWDKTNGRGMGGDPRVFELTKGDHVLRIWTRENEAWLDCIFMSTDPTAIPILASEFEGRERTGKPQAVTYTGKMAATWGQIKGSL